MAHVMTVGQERIKGGEKGGKAQPRGLLKARNLSYNKIEVYLGP